MPSMTLYTQVCPYPGADSVPRTAGGLSPHSRGLVPAQQGACPRTAGGLSPPCPRRAGEQQGNQPPNPALVPAKQGNFAQHKSLCHHPGSLMRYTG
jgi:hypothetical protein